MFTIGQISEQFGLPISTLRYYDRQGLFPGMERTSGARRFGPREVETLRLIECLKKSGLEIRDIKQFIDWCQQGSETFPQRKEMFEKQRETVEKEIEHMEKVLDMLKFKCWFYEQAMAEGSDERLMGLLPDGLPEEIQRVYDHAHS